MSCLIYKKIYMMDLWQPENSHKQDVQSSPMLLYLDNEITTLEETPRF